MTEKGKSQIQRKVVFSKKPDGVYIMKRCLKSYTNKLIDRQVNIVMVFHQNIFKY